MNYQDEDINMFDNSLGDICTDDVRVTSDEWSGRGYKENQKKGKVIIDGWYIKVFRE